jgi:hypothetical protein
MVCLKPLFFKLRRRVSGLSYPPVPQAPPGVIHIPHLRRGFPNLQIFKLPNTRPNVPQQHFQQINLLVRYERAAYCCSFLYFFACACYTKRSAPQTPGKVMCRALLPDIGSEGCSFSLLISDLFTGFMNDFSFIINYYGILCMNFHLFT